MALWCAEKGAVRHSTLSPERCVGSCGSSDDDTKGDRPSVGKMVLEAYDRSSNALMQEFAGLGFVQRVCRCAISFGAGDVHYRNAGMHGFATM